MMFSMNNVESAPLVRSQWSEYRMVQQPRALAVAAFAVGNSLVHLCDFSFDISCYILGRSTLRSYTHRRLPSSRQIAQTGYQPDSESLFKEQPRSKRTSSLQAFPKSSRSARIR